MRALNPNGPPKGDFQPQIADGTDGEMVGGEEDRDSDNESSARALVYIILLCIGVK